MSQRSLRGLAGALLCLLVFGGACGERARVGRKV